MSTVALIRLGLALLPEIQTGVAQFVAWLQELRSAAQQSGEWTTDQETQFRAALLNAPVRPEELPDSPPANPT